MLHVTSVCTPCYILLGVVAQSFKLVKLKSPTPNLSFVITSSHPYVPIKIRYTRGGKLKGEITMYEIKKGLRLISKEVKLKGKRKLNTISWNLRLILSKGLKKLQRYVSSKKIKLLWKLQCCSVDLLTPTPQKLKGRSLIRVQFTCTVVKPFKNRNGWLRNWFKLWRIVYENRR